MVPPEIRGVWKRRSIAVDGGEPQETAHVLWLQAAEGFADLRVPNPGTGCIEAFAGTTHWDSPRLTWNHTIDWNGGFAEYDCGDVEWRGDALIERGTFASGGRVVPYEEVWDPVDAGDRSIVFTAPEAVIVQVGSYSLALRDGRRRASATFDVRSAHWSEEHGWRDTHVFGAGAELPLASHAYSHPEWRVTESTPEPVPR